MNKALILGPAQNPYTKDRPRPDYELERLVSNGVDVVAEGRIHYPHEARKIKDLGVAGIVVGEQ